jgi:hypothetical protein
LEEHIECRNNSNPAFTIPELRELLEVLGLWGDGWKDGKFQKWFDDINIDKLNVPAGLTKYDILTTTSLFTKAVESFMKEVEG